MFLDNGTGTGNVTIAMNAVCRSLNCTGYTGTLTYDTNARTLTIGDGTAGAGNIALKFDAGMTYTILAVSNVITFASTHSTQESITWAGKAPGDVAFSGASGTPSRQFTDGLTATGSTVSLNRGTLDINGQTVSISQLTISGSTARTLTLGAASITLAGSSSSWSAATLTNFTMTANTATVTMSGVNPAFTSAAFDYNGLSVVYTGAGTASAPSGCTVANLTRTGTADPDDNLRFSGANTTITGTLTVNGNSDVNRLHVFSNSVGVARTITAGTVVASYVDFTDITGAGAADWDLSGITGGSGDGQGNSGITFTSPVTQTYVGGTANWAAAASWTSRIPLPQDDVIINTTTAGTLTGSALRSGRNVDFTGFTRTFTLATPTTIYGNLTLASGMTITGTQGWTMAGRGAQTITTNGKTLTQTHVITCPGGSYTLQDNYTSNRNNAGALTINAGTFDANDKDITLSGASGGVVISGTATVNMGNGTWTMSGSNSGNKWNASGASLTINCEGSTVVIAGNGAVTKTFAGGGYTYNILASITNNVAMTLAITGSNTFAEIRRSDPVVAGAITFLAGRNNTIGVVNIFGVAGQLMTFSSSAAGSSTTITSPTPGNIGANSTSVSGNTGVSIAGGTLMDYLSMQDITWVYTPVSTSTGATVLMMGA